VLLAFEQQHRARAEHRHQRDGAPGRKSVLVLGVERAQHLGSDSITIGRSKPTKRTLKASPKRRRQDSMNEIGRTSHRSVCTAGARWDRAEESCDALTPTA